ncbi:hypothetical protein GEMRC1_011990 [Eukaryota sp. GEM-RC1]
MIFDSTEEEQRDETLPEEESMWGYTVEAPRRTPNRRLSTTSNSDVNKNSQACLFFFKKSGCPHGSSCTYSHDLSKMRNHPLYKTRRCEKPNCPLGGTYCSYAHSDDELRPGKLLCKYGADCYRSDCAFAHPPRSPRAPRSSFLPENRADAVPIRSLLNRIVATPQTPAASDSSHIQLRLCNTPEPHGLEVLHDSPSTPVVALSSFPTATSFADLDLDLVSTKFQENFDHLLTKLHSFDPVFSHSYQYTCLFDGSDGYYKFRLILSPFTFVELCSTDKVEQFKENIFFPFPPPLPFPNKFKNLTAIGSKVLL